MDVTADLGHLAGHEDMRLYLANQCADISSQDCDTVHSGGYSYSEMKIT